MIAYEHIADRFYRDLTSLFSDAHGTIYILLSGGIDSFLLLAAIMKCYAPDKVIALTIRGIDDREYMRARQAARWYGIRHYTLYFTPDLFLSNLHVIHPDSNKTLIACFFNVALVLLLNRYSVKGSRVCHGDGADTAFGTYSAQFIYRNVPSIMRDFNLDANQAREHIRRDVYYAVKRNPPKGTTGTILYNTISAFGGIPIAPFSTTLFSYLLDVPLTALKGDKKEWVRLFLAEYYSVPSKLIASRKRVNMQDGTGFYRQVKDTLRETYGTVNMQKILRVLASNG